MAGAGQKATENKRSKVFSSGKGWDDYLRLERIEAFEGFYEYVAGVLFLPLWK